MSSLLTTGFEAGSWTFYLNTGWAKTGSGNPLVDSHGSHTDGAGRGGSNTLMLASGQGALTSVYDYAHWISFALLLDIGGGPSSTTGMRLALGDPDAPVTPHAEILFRTDGYISIIRGDGSTAATSGPTYDPHIFNWFDIELSAANSGYCKVYIGLSVTPIVEATGDFLWATDPDGWTGLHFKNTITSPNPVYIDDVRVARLADGRPAGEIYCVPLAPTSDITSVLTPSTGSAHYACIDERPPSMTDYVGGTIDNGTDVLGCADLPYAAAAIETINLCMIGQVGDGNINYVGGLLTSGSDLTETAWINHPETAEYRMTSFETDPATDEPWTAEAVNAVKLSVIISSTGGGGK